MIQVNPHNDYEEDFRIRNGSSSNGISNDLL